MPEHNPTLSSQPTALWLSRLTNRVGQLRSRLDFDDIAQPNTVEERLLREVLRQMLERPLTLISRGLSTAELERKEKGLRSKAFRRFGGETGLASYALTEVVRPDRSDLTDILIDSAGQAMLDPAADCENVIRQLGAAYFEAVCDDPCLTYQTFAWLGAREDAQLRVAFGELYSSLGNRVAEGLDLFLAASGRTTVAGRSTSDIATVLTSLTEGLAMRSAVDPDSATAELAAEASLAVVLRLSEALPDASAPATPEGRSTRSKDAQLAR